MDPPKDQSTANKLSYEELFNSQLALLVNQANCEFMFVRDFFLADDDVTLGIFARCSDLLLENLDEHISPSFDAIGMLIILCLIDRYTELVPPNLEYLLHSLQKATTSVFTRFVIVFELNMASIRNANIQDLGPIDIRTHYITRRYGEFAASILTLYGTLPDLLRDKIAICMTKIREVMAKLLTTMSEELKEKKDQSVFLVNNCDLILALVREKGVNAEEIAFFTNLLSQASDAFVKTQLMSASYISQISSFVEEIAPLAQKGEVTHPKYNKEFVEELLRQFAKHWQAGIAGWSAEIPKLFTNFKMGTQLFQKIVEKMFSYLKSEHV